MALFFYKKDKRVLRIDDLSSKEKTDTLKALGYIQVLDRRNPEGSKVVIPKPKAKAKAKPKAKAKAKKK